MFGRGGCFLYWKKRVIFERQRERGAVVTLKLSEKKRRTRRTRTRTRTRNGGKGFSCRFLLSLSQRKTKGMQKDVS